MQDIPNISTIFMVPTLKIDPLSLEQHGFIEAFSRNVEMANEYENCVFLLFKPPDAYKIDYFIDGEYDRTPQLIQDFDYEDFVVLIYSLDTKYLEDFNKIKEGKYSSTSSEFKALFPKVKKNIVNGKYKDELSLQYLIFTKNEDLRKHWENMLGVTISPNMECWTTWNDEKETLDMNKIKENYSKYGINE